MNKDGRKTDNNVSSNGLKSLPYLFRNPKNVFFGI